MKQNKKFINITLHSLSFLTNLQYSRKRQKIRGENKKRNKIKKTKNNTPNKNKDK